MRRTGGSEKACFSLGILFLIFTSASLAKGAESRWVEKAKVEKELRLYGTMAIPDMKKLTESFEKKYPFVKVKYFRAGGEKLAQKIYTEVRAGRHLGDVYHISGAEMVQLVEQGFLSRYESPNRKFIRDIFKDKEGYWTGTHVTVEAIGYNTGLVRPEEVPRSYEDLLHPRWKGRMGMDSTAIEWYIIHLHNIGGEKGREFMKGLGRQDVRVRRGHTLGAQLLAAGEYALLLDLRTHRFEQLRGVGAPLGITGFGPLIPMPASSIGLPKRPPHPNTGRLFIDFMLSKEAQEVVQKALGREVTRLGVQPVSGLVRKLGFAGIDWPFYLKSYNKYQAEFRKIFLK